MRNLRIKEKEKLSQILGSALQELTEEAEQDTHEGFGAIQTLFLGLINNLESPSYNLTKEDRKLCTVVLYNGLLNLKQERDELKSFLTQFEKEVEEGTKSSMGKEKELQFLEYAQEIKEEIELFGSLFEATRIDFDSEQDDGR